MENEKEVLPTPVEAKVGKVTTGSRTELIKAFLEFISKSFYPGILIAVIILLQPAFEKIDFTTLIDRLQSAKAGEYEFTFKQAEDVGAETAPLNNKVAELDRLISTLQSDIGLLQKSVVTAQLSESELKIREAQENQFQTNSKYTALVFHRRESRDKGQRVVDALLDAGFKSSDTETNFSELRKVKPMPGVIFVTYNLAGEVLLPEIKKLLGSLFQDTEIKINPRAIELRRGDVQVLVF